MSSAGIAAANCLLAAIHAQKRREEEEAEKSSKQSCDNDGTEPEIDLNEIHLSSEG